MSAPIIAIDAMGGDHGPRCIVPASLSCLADFPSLKLILTGRSAELEALVAAGPDIAPGRLRVVEAREVVAMDERPAQALRGKPDSSMRRALELVRDGAAHACVSAGNTGALMALSRYVLKTLPGIDRPAMAAAIPTERGFCLLLDLGANVDCNAEHLYQFAVMGAVAAQSLGILQPRVALLNVGTEDIKGNQQVKLAASLLRQARTIRFTGFVEGDGLFRGEADVVVCDGFVGNILLKSSEGLAGMVSTQLDSLFRQTPLKRLAGMLARPVLRQLGRQLAPAAHNGATFLGLQGIVVKSHGSAGEAGFRSAIHRAAEDVQHDLPGRLHEQLEHLL